ncbi:hypothetical protein RYX36_023964 [Vicia faba]
MGFMVKPRREILKGKRGIGPHFVPNISAILSSTLQQFWPPGIVAAVPKIAPDGGAAQIRNSPLSPGCSQPPLISPNLHKKLRGAAIYK